MTQFVLGSMLETVSPNDCEKNKFDLKGTSSMIFESPRREIVGWESLAIDCYLKNAAQGNTLSLSRFGSIFL